jgi:hypothetical protein
VRIRNRWQQQSLFAPDRVDLLGFVQMVMPLDREGVRGEEQPDRKRAVRGTDQQSRRLPGREIAPQISVTSEIGTGSTFTVSLPLKEAESHG